MNVAKYRETPGMRFALPLLCLLLATGISGAAVTIGEAREAHRRGDYEESVRLCRAGIAGDLFGRGDWHLCLIRAQMTLGWYDEAWKSLQEGLAATRNRDIRLLHLGREVAFFQDDPEAARNYVRRIDELSVDQSLFTNPDSRVVLGRTALLVGMEPKDVLHIFFDPGANLDPPHRDSLLAAGQLALDKEEYRLAAEIFAKGFDAYEEDPDILHGYALAMATSDPEETSALVTLALDANPRHIPTLLLVADRAIDAEDYAGARQALDAVLDINKDHPGAWSYRAVLAQLDSDPEEEARARDRALVHWSANPEVDHLIGRKLSRKYLFREGAGSQRRALEMDRFFSRAQLQLGQDLLRLGREEEGWDWIERSHDHDGYNRTAYNLLTLKTTLDDYAVLENEHFLIRMSAEEAPVFGQRVMDLLEEARGILCARYEVDLEERTVLEMFDHQKHFAVRTFGMPHNPGFLGVCFGDVITSNSPSTHGGNPSNWEAVIWHEFCHVVTLNKTRNRMPRWLSEGISVHEELQRDPSWGQSMTPAYRQRIVEGRVTPVSRLSSAFLEAESGEDMQFAYYQSALVVRYLVEKWGMESLRNILVRLGEGVAINEALAGSTVPIEELDEGFGEWILAEARRMGRGLSWNVPEESVEEISPEAALRLIPDNYHLLLRLAQSLVEEEKWEEAVKPLERILESWPVVPGNEQVPLLLARCRRELGEKEKERELLRRIAETDDEALFAYRRLVDRAMEEEAWEEALLNLQRILAVDPLLPDTYRKLARVREARGEPEEAIGAWERLLHCEPPDPGNVHYQVARLRHGTGAGGAREHVLRALEEAPRFRDAYRLLRRIRGLDGETVP